MLAGVGSGLGLPCRVYVHQDRVAQGQVGMGEACGGRSRDRSGHRQGAAHCGSQDIGLSVRDVECLVCRTVLIHPDCEMEPGFRVRIRRSSICHSCEGRRDPMVKALAELDHDGDDANRPLCVEYTNTMTRVRSRNSLNGSVGASRCSSKSSIKESALSARASGRRGAVWELGEAYLRPRARRSITKLRSKVVSRESARSAYRKVLWVSVD